MRELAQRIIDNCSGRAMLGVEAGTILMECIDDSVGDYVEIGSAVGGSAIMAGMAMDKTERPGTVFCIDPFGGGNELDGIDMMLRLFWNNLLKFDLQQRVIAFKQCHPPFPMPIWYHTFSVGLIDGCHTGNSPLIDFRQLNKRVTKYLLFDNTEKEDVLTAIKKATQDNSNWEEYKSIEYESTWKEDKIIKFVVLRRKH